MRGRGHHNTLFLTPRHLKADREEHSKGDILLSQVAEEFQKCEACLEVYKGAGVCKGSCSGGAASAGSTLLNQPWVKSSRAPRGFEPLPASPLDIGAVFREAGPRAKVFQTEKGLRFISIP